MHTIFFFIRYIDEHEPQRRSAKFQHCPKGYCCLTPRCPAIDTCATNRQGRLCGRCRPGFSEALFTPSCVPNEKCGPVWLIPFSVFVGVTYTLFLLFQTDLKQFLFSEPIECGIKRKIKRAYQNGYYKNEARVQLNGHLQQQDGVEIKFMDGNIDGHVDSNLTLTESLHNDEEKSPKKSSKSKHNGTSSEGESAPNSNSAARVATGSGFLIINILLFPSEYHSTIGELCSKNILIISFRLYCFKSR